MAAAEVVGLAGRRGPQPRDDLELLLQPLETLPEGGEGDPVSEMFLLEPSSSETELDAASAHGVDLGHGDGERTGEPEGGSREQGPETDAFGIASKAGEGNPRVGRSGQARAHPIFK